MSCKWAKGFNPRTRVGCDKHRAIASATLSRFNPRTRVGCDIKKYGLSTAEMVFQSTHPRGVRRAATGGNMLTEQVSIHAPAWGATCWISPVSRMPDKVSIHAPAWGATHDYRGHGRSAGVSIHAPAWGATASPSKSTQPTGGFNPRTRVGCDAQYVIPSGVRDGVSIHAPAWGATSATHVLSNVAEVSIHAPAWGATAVPSPTWRRRICFNPRTRVGCDCFHVLSSRFP